MTSQGEGKWRVARWLKVRSDVVEVSLSCDDSSYDKCNPSGNDSEDKFTAEVMAGKTATAVQMR